MLNNKKPEEIQLYVGLVKDESSADCFQNSLNSFALEKSNVTEKVGI